MFFDLSPEQRLLHTTVRSYFAAEHPVSDVRRAAEGAETRFDAAWVGLHELGLGGLLVSPGHGGSGPSVLDAAVAAQALGECAAPGAVVDCWLVTHALQRWGSPTQQQRWMSGLVDGSSRAAANWADGRPVVGAQHADVILGVDGDSMSLYEPAEVKVQPLPGIDLTRPIADVTPTGSGDPLPGSSADSVAHLRAVGRVLIAAGAFGTGLQALSASVDYAKVRRQGGRLIGEYQAVKHQLAELALLIEPAQALVWYAAHLLDSDRKDAPGSAALAKAHVTARTVDVVRGAIELHGGIGYTWECDLHVHLKRALLDRELLGDPTTLQDEIADQLYGPVVR